MIPTPITLLFVMIGNYILDIQGMTLSYWAILFTTSCLANLLGLNISSSFNSAVTIYILIPILLIPQLLLSGVVVRFDKLNPTLSSDSTVPLVGELMASRWALEAAIVHQFKNNEYEKHFYTYDKIMADADYMKVYYIPTMESKLQYCYINFKVADEATKDKFDASLALLRNEIKKELNYVGQDKFGRVEDLYPETFDAQLYDDTFNFLETLRKFYVNRYNKADEFKEKAIQELINPLLIRSDIISVIVTGTKNKPIAVALSSDATVSSQYGIEVTTSLS